MNTVVPFQSNPNEHVLPADIYTIKNDISSLQAFLDCALGAIFLGDKSVIDNSLLSDAGSYGYCIQEIMEGVAVLEISGRRYRIRSQVLHEPQFCSAVYEALQAESESNLARVEWIRARAVLQHTTNTMLSPGLGGVN